MSQCSLHVHVHYQNYHCHYLQIQEEIMNRDGNGLSVNTEHAFARYCTSSTHVDLYCTFCFSLLIKLKRYSKLRGMMPLNS